MKALGHSRDCALILYDKRRGGCNKVPTVFKEHVTGFNMNGLLTTWQVPNISVRRNFNE